MYQFYEKNFKNNNNNNLISGAEKDTELVLDEIDEGLKFWKFDIFLEICQTYPVDGFAAEQLLCAGIETFETCAGRVGWVIWNNSYWKFKKIRDVIKINNRKSLVILKKIF